jgi:hypothetical protein
MEYKMFSYHTTWLPERPPQYQKSTMTPYEIQKHNELHPEHSLKEEESADHIVTNLSLLDEEIRCIESSMTSIRLRDCVPVQQENFLMKCQQKIIIPKTVRFKQPNVLGVTLEGMNEQLTNKVIDIFIDQTVHRDAQADGVGRREAFDKSFDSSPPKTSLSTSSQDAIEEAYLPSHALAHSSTPSAIDEDASSSSSSSSSASFSPAANSSSSSSSSSSSASSSSSDLRTPGTSSTFSSSESAWNQAAMSHVQLNEKNKIRTQMMKDIKKESTTTSGFIVWLKAHYNCAYTTEIYDYLLPFGTKTLATYSGPMIRGCEVRIQDIFIYKSCKTNYFFHLRHSFFV